MDTRNEKVLQELNNIKIINLKSNYKIEKKIDEIRVNIDKEFNDIKISLYGDVKGDIKGIVQKIQEHSDYIEKDKKNKWLVRGGLIVIVGILKFWKFIVIFLKSVII